MTTIEKAPRIITKEEAKASGRKRYYTGEPCQHGHVCERFVKRSWCVECARLGLKPELRISQTGAVDGRSRRQGVRT
jgi:hypothetical protein